MGGIKNLLIRQAELGYSMPQSAAICPDCLGEADLANFAERRLTEPHCDFCGRDRSEFIATDTEKVLEHVARSLRLEFEPAIDALGYDAESDNGYAGVTFDIREAIEHVDTGIESEKFGKFLWTAFADSLWCERDPYAVRPHQQLVIDWNAFRRLTQVAPEVDLTAALPQAPDDDAPLRDASEMLKQIGAFVTEVDLARHVPAGTRIARGRVDAPTATHSRATDLGTPPDIAARGGRMNRAGAPVFYGAENPSTVKAEVIDAQKDRGQVLTIGMFETTESAWLADLSKLPELPGIFDEQRQHQRDAILFLQAFRDDISRPARPDADTHPEYRPTQIMAEHLMNHVGAPDGSRFAGLVYPSAPQPGSENLVLWVARKDCIDASDPATEGRLQLRLVHVASPETVT